VTDPYLKVKDGGGERQVVLWPSMVCRIGRSDHNDVVLTDTVASREHAMIRRDGDERCILMDAGSRNGTLVNGRPVTAPTRLNDGDVVAIGVHEFSFHDPHRAPAPEGVPSHATTATMFIPQQSLVTVLVIDIRGFTPLSREIGEERISAVMATIIRETGARLEHTRCWSQKFTGDGVMAVWKHGPNGLRAADLTAVLGVLASLERLLAEVKERFALPRPLAFGAAINTGSASIGNMGSGASADFTALGDTVNKAFRLETASKDLGVDLVIGEATFNELSPALAPNLLPPSADVMLKGYDSPQRARLLLLSDIPRLVKLLVL
jgi:adenylate cyclase